MVILKLKVNIARFRAYLYQDTQPWTRSSPVDDKPAFFCYSGFELLDHHPY